MIKPSLWLCMDKDGSIHATNYEPIRPTPTKDNPDVNNDIFIPNQLAAASGSFFFVRIDGGAFHDLAINAGLTFENSPKEIINIKL